MPPEQSINPDPYGFIMNPQKPKRPALFGGGMKLKFVVIGIIVVLVMILGVGVSNILSASGNAQKNKLIKLAQTQTEIVRLANAAAIKAATPETKSLAITTQLSVESSGNQTKDALSKYGVKANAKLLSAGKDAKSDATLDEATKTSRYDEAYKKLLSEQLSDYQKQLKSAFDSATKKQKIFLNNAGNSNTLILSTFEQS